MVVLSSLYTPFNYQNLFIYLFLYLVTSYRSLVALILPAIFYLFYYFLCIIVLLKTFKALNGICELMHH